jgi:hypothetical protein
LRQACRTSLRFTAALSSRRDVRTRVKSPGGLAPAFKCSISLAWPAGCHRLPGCAAGADALS